MLWIGGIKVPSPALNGLDISKEKIWSKNAGRVANGGMVGDIVAVKHTLNITWPPLSREQTVQIDSLIAPTFFSVKFLDPGSNSYVTRTFYSGTPSYPVYSYADGVKTYRGVGVTLIEQ